MKKGLLPNIPTVWEEIMSQGIREQRNKSLKPLACKLAWGAAVYNIWRQRNDVKHGNQIRTEEKVTQNIGWEVRNRVMGKREV